MGLKFRHFDPVLILHFTFHFHSLILHFTFYILNNFPPKADLWEKKTAKTNKLQFSLFNKTMETT